jgi:Protein of unknown function
MRKEIPIPNPPPSAKEESAIAKLTEADLQAIDSTILANCSHDWLKVARVILHTEKALKGRYSPDLTFVFYTLRLMQLVMDGRLASQGNLQYMRFSEVRLVEVTSLPE